MATAVATAVRPGFGIGLVLLAMLIFAGQDAVTKTLVAALPVAQVVMVRHVVFALFATLLIAAKPGGVTHALRADRPWLQVLRASIAVFEIGLFAFTVTRIPLSSALAIFAICPLVTTALAALVLGERVGPARWLAVTAGFAGVLVVLRPGAAVFDPDALLAVACAVIFGFYQVLSRLVSRTDSFETTYGYSAWIGCLLTLLVGPFVWVAPSGAEWLMLGILSTTGITGHMLLMKALQTAPASTVQPFTYTQLVWGLLIAVTVFGERPDAATLGGAAAIVAAGLLALRAR
ncbi:MAG: DMT family transporter [Geminicoccaceae bacterium]|nr:DMT family transporter [Geminicoccaceae bacterium]